MEFLTNLWDNLSNIYFLIIMFIFTPNIFVSYLYYKIVRNQMKIGGEEYGEIVATKVNSLAIASMLISIFVIVGSIVFYIFQAANAIA